MTPNPRAHSTRVHVSTRTARRFVALIAAIIAIGGAPLVARAIGDDAGAIPGGVGEAGSGLELAVGHAEGQAGPHLGVATEGSRDPEPRRP